MKRFIIIVFVLVAMFSCREVKALSIATTSDSSAGQTVTLITAAAYVDFITVSNSENLPRRVDIWDSMTYKGSISVGAKSSWPSAPIKLRIRFATALRVFMSGAYMSVTVGYMSGSGNGHYPYGVTNDTAMNTPYSSPGDVIGIMVSNWSDENTGRSATFSDSFVNKVRITCPAFSTIYYDLDRFHVNSFQITNEDTEMATTIIRRE